MDAVDLKQELHVIDYLGALTVWISFFVIFAIVSICINWCCIQKYDDITVFEEWGYKHNIKVPMGRHRPTVVARKLALTKESKETNIYDEPSRGHTLQTGTGDAFPLL